MRAKTALRGIRRARSYTFNPILSFALSRMRLFFMIVSSSLILTSRYPWILALPVRFVHVSLAASSRSRIAGPAGVRSLPVSPGCLRA